MIFDNNSTVLGTTMNIPMAEGYDGSCGAALALIESARNDYAMFKSMLSVDAAEINLRESAGYVNEAEIVSLQEASIGGIWKKIVEVLKKLVAKIKSIFHTFASKINALFMKDKALAKKYEKEILRKSNLGKMEVKWANIRNDIYAYEIINDAGLATGSDVKKWASDYKTETDERVNYFLGQGKVSPLSNPDKDEFTTDFHEYFFDDEETMELGEATGINIRTIIEDMKSHDSKWNKVESQQKKIENKLTKLVSDVDKWANEEGKVRNGFGKDRFGDATVADVGTDDVKKKAADDRVKEANKCYDMVQAYQTAVLMVYQAYMTEYKYKYKLEKAIFMKAIAANDKKLEESAVYADAIAEAAANEVEDVISSALSNEELSKICAASKNVKDADVSDDYNKLTYGLDCYTPNRSYVDASGSIDSNINGKSESALFADLLY